MRNGGRNYFHIFTFPTMVTIDRISNRYCMRCYNPPSNTYFSSPAGWVREKDYVILITSSYLYVKSSLMKIMIICRNRGYLQYRRVNLDCPVTNVLKFIQEKSLNLFSLLKFYESPSYCDSWKMIKAPCYHCY